MVLFPKGRTLIFLTTSPGKPVRSVKGSGKVSTKWLKPQMQVIRVQGLSLKHRLDFDKYLAFPGKSSSAPQQNGQAHLSFSCSTSCLQREKALKHWCSWRTQENQVQFQWMHTKITWAWNCHKTVTSNHQPSAGDAKALGASPYPQKQTWIKEGRRGLISCTS